MWIIAFFGCWAAGINIHKIFSSFWLCLIVPLTKPTCTITHGLRQRGQWGAVAPSWNLKFSFLTIETDKMFIFWPFKRSKLGFCPLLETNKSFSDSLPPWKNFCRRPCNYTLSNTHNPTVYSTYEYNCLERDECRQTKNNMQPRNCCISMHHCVLISYD